MAEDVDSPPRNLLICFEDVGIENDTPQGNLARPWTPPESRTAFDSRDEICLLWNDGQIQVQQHGIGNGYRRYSSCSLFYDSYQQGYLQIRYSCLEENVSDRRRRCERDGWKELRFERPGQGVAISHPDLILVGSTLRDEVIARPTNDLWQLLLGAKYFNTDAEPTYTCELAGSLAILFGLVAFTADWQNLLTAVRKTFASPGHDGHFPNFAPPWTYAHPEEAGRSQHRGLIVKIYYRPAITPKANIEMYELGHRGRVLCAHPGFARNLW